MLGPQTSNARFASARAALSTHWSDWVARWTRVRTALRPAKPWLWLTLFALAVSWAYSDPNQLRSHAAVAEAHGDGYYYYAYLRSLAFDRDVDFSNDYELLPDQFHAGVNPITKRPQNVFTVGPALFWMPLVPVAHVAQRIAERFGAPHVPKLNGAEYDFQRVVLYGSVLAGLVTTGLGMAIALSVAEASLAALAAIGICLGSPLIWFMLRQPSFSHAAQSCAVAMMVAFWWWRFGSRQAWHWVATGALLGLAMNVRPQDVTHGLLPFSEWCLMALPLARSGASREERLAWLRNGLLLLAATAVAFLPLLLIWKRIYGAWTLVPQGSSFMDWANSRWDATLFSSRGGLFAWHPLLLIAACGLLALVCWRRQPTRLRLLAGCALVVLLTQSYINGAARDWWGGWAFGGRRFSGCLIYFMIGLAAVLEGGRRFVLRRPLRVAQLGGLAMIAAFALYNRSLADDYTFFRLWLDKAQPMKRGIAAAMNKTLDEAYAITGNPGSWPMNLLFAWRTGGSPEAYDTIAAADLDASPFMQEVPLDAFHAAAGFEPESEFLGRRVRIAKQRKASWGYAVRVAVSGHGVVRLAASRPGIRVKMRIGRTYFFDRRTKKGFHDYRFKLPPTSAGLVIVNVEQSLRQPGDFVAWDHLALTLHDDRPPPATEPPPAEDN